MASFLSRPHIMSVMHAMHINFGVGCSPLEDIYMYTMSISRQTCFSLHNTLTHFVAEAPIVERGVPNGLSYEVQEGGRVEFSCFPRGVPQPNVTWYRGVSQDMDAIMQYCNLYTPIFQDPAEGDVILDGAEQGPYRIDPTSHSLVILNVNESLLKPTFTCEASNRFGKKTISYTAGLSNTCMYSIYVY